MPAKRLGQLLQVAALAVAVIAAVANLVAPARVDMVPGAIEAPWWPTHWWHWLVVVGWVLGLTGLAFDFWRTPARTPAAPQRLSLWWQLLLIVVALDLVVVLPITLLWWLSGWGFVAGCLVWFIAVTQLASRPFQSRGSGVRQARSWGLLIATSVVGSALAVGLATRIGNPAPHGFYDPVVPWAWPVLLVGHLGVPFIAGWWAARAQNSKFTVR